MGPRRLAARSTFALACLASCARAPDAPPRRAPAASSSTHAAPIARPAPPAPTAGSTAADNAAAALRALRNDNAPVARVEVSPELQGWNLPRGSWIAEARVTFSNNLTTPVEVRPRMLVARAPGGGVDVGFRGGDGTVARVLAPGDSVSGQAVFTPTGERAEELPRSLQFTYGSPAHGGLNLSLPVQRVALEGLAITVDPSATYTRHARPRVGTGPEQYAWSVRLALTLRNPTQAPVRVLPNAFEARREDGGASYWGDGAGYSGEELIAPGQQLRAALTLAFGDTPRPPTTVTLRYATRAGAPPLFSQTIPLSEAPGPR